MCVQVCTHEGCFRIVRTRKRHGSINTLCSEHMTRLTIAVYEMFNDWCIESSPRGRLAAFIPSPGARSRMVTRKVKPSRKSQQPDISPEETLCKDSEQDALQQQQRRQRRWRADKRPAAGEPMQEYNRCSPSAMNQSCRVDVFNSL